MHRYLHMRGRSSRMRIASGHEVKLNECFVMYSLLHYYLHVWVSLHSRGRPKKKVDIPIRLAMYTCSSGNRLKVPKR